MNLLCSIFFILFALPAMAAETHPGGTNGQVQYNNNSYFGGFTLGGDCTLVVSTGVITCTKTNGTAFAHSATVDATVTWPTSGKVLISSGNNSPTGVAEVDGDCLVGSAGSWVAGGCGAGGGGVTSISGDGTYITNSSSTGAVTLTTAFGTAALKNTGTSGANVPLLNGSNTASGNNIQSGSFAVTGTSTPTQGAGTLGIAGIASTPTPGANSEGDIWLSSTGGLNLIGQGSTNDFTIFNSAKTSACTIATGTTNLNCVGLQVGGTAVSTQTFGTLTNGDWCTSNGTSISCATAAPVTSITGDGTYITNSGSTGAVTLTTTFGTAAQKNTGTSGATVPLLNGSNTASGSNVQSGSFAITGTSTPSQAAGTLGLAGTATKPTLGASSEGDVFLTSADGFNIIGQGSTNDFRLWNKSGTSVCVVATGGTTLNCTGLQVGGTNVLTSAVTSLSGDGTLITNSSSTGAVTLTLGNAGAGTVWANNTSSSATPAYTAAPVLGQNATTAGTLGLANGGASGTTITIKNLGNTSAYNFNLPATVGSANQPMLSQAGGSTSMTWGSLTGNTSTFATSTGSLVSGDCAKWDANGNIIDAGAACGGGGGVTWPATGDVVVSAGVSSNPNGVAEVDGDCLVGASGSWSAGSCSTGSGTVTSITCSTGLTCTASNPITASGTVTLAKFPQAMEANVAMISFGGI